MQITSAFDSGNIEVVAADAADDIRLRIRPDGRADFRQWFHFRLSGARGAACALKIVNGDEIAYRGGFRDYRAVASYDRQHWFRVPTEFDGTVLTIRHTPERDAVWYAYFAPYSLERHLDLVARCQMDGRVRLESLGATVDGRDLDLLTIGEAGPGKRVCWVIGRQHPGESMASWWMEGFLDALLDRDDPVARQALAGAVFHVVPLVNPDGAVRGHLRTNAAGLDLNRQWRDPDPQTAPEIFLIRRRMVETGVDFCLDVHGDEEIPHNFIAGYEGIPTYTDRMAALLQEYPARLAALTGDFQTVHGYPKTAPGKANLAMCTANVAESFQCLALTLEMPFKDTADHPRPDVGWSPRRCAKLAEACLAALVPMLPTLR